MRQLTKMGMLLAFGGLLASCSNDNIDNPNVTPQPVEGDGMYMTVNVSLPSVKGTRAESFGGYSEGLEKEYAVNAVDLYLFKLEEGSLNTGTVENTATYYDKVSLGFGDLEEQGNDVTGKFQATFQIKGIELNDDNELVDEAGKKYELYGLLIVNPIDEYLPISGTKLVKGSTTFDTWNKEVLTGLTEGTVAQDYTKYMIDATRGFMMTNAPKYDNEEASVLVLLDTDEFALSPKDAKNAAAEFFVQRGVAKVYLTGDDEFKEMKVYDGPATSDYKTDAYVQVDNWELDVTNQLTFPVQNVIGSGETSPEYKNWEGDHFFETGNYYLNNHIWWAVDPNYYNTTDETNNYKFSTITETKNHDWTSARTPVYNEENPDATSYAYCLENTMTQSQMIQNQSTRVVFKCKYIFDGEEEEDWSSTSDNAGFIVFNDKAMLVKKTDLVDEKDVPEAGTTTLAALVGDNYADYKSGLMMGSENDDIDWYPGGVTYYVSYIRHFNDDEAPIPYGVDTSSSSFVSSSLASWSYAQLGRYGVLRNNVYEINVLGFYGYGSPDIPTPGDTPDDKTPEKKYNAIVDVNVLNWAKRSNDYIPR